MALRAQGSSKAWVVTSVEVTAPPALPGRHLPMGGVVHGVRLGSADAMGCLIAVIGGYVGVGVPATAEGHSRGAPKGSVGGSVGGSVRGRSSVALERVDEMLQSRPTGAHMSAAAVSPLGRRWTPARRSSAGSACGGT